MSLASKTLVMLVAPSAMGKSTIMNETVRLDARFARVRSFTTRAQRPDDESGLYRYISQQEAAQKIASGELVQYAISPTTGQVYGSESEDYPAPYNLLDMLSNGVSELRHASFHQTITVSLTTTPERWRTWFLTRYPTSSDESTKRLEEAKLSINWSLGDTQTKWLINDDTPEKVAAKLIAIVRGEMPSDDGQDAARAILNLIKEGAVYL